MTAERNLDRVVLALGAVLLVLALVAIPFGGADSSGSQPSAGDGRATNGVAIVNFKFRPQEVTIQAGTKVTWTNEDSAPHTATAEGGKFAFDTGTLDRGEAKSVTLAKPGTYEYICDIHPFMTGTVTVE